MTAGSLDCEQSQPAEALVASSQLHKQLLAQEVVKLRREVATLRASASFPTVEDDEEIRSQGGRCARAACWCAEREAGADRIGHRSRRLKQETQNLEAQKQAIIAQANAQKALLAKEIKSLRAEVEKVPGGGAGRE